MFPAGHWAALQCGVREAGLEHDDLVLAARVGQGARVRGMLLGFVEQRVHVGWGVAAGKPFRPVGDVGAVADGFRSPAVVGVADEIVVLVERPAEVAVAVGQPVFAGGMMDEDELDHFIRWVRVDGLGLR